MSGDKPDKPEPRPKPDPPREPYDPTDPEHRADLEALARVAHNRARAVISSSWNPSSRDHSWIYRYNDHRVGSDAPSDEDVLSLFDDAKALV